MYIYIGIKEQCRWLQGMVEFCCFSCNVLGQHIYCDFTEAAVCFGFLFMCMTANFFHILSPDTLWTQTTGSHSSTVCDSGTSPYHKHLTVLCINRNQKKLLHQENHEKCAS